MIESKLKFGAVFGIVSCLILIIILIYGFFKFGLPNLPIYFSLAIILFLVLIFIWLLFGELRTKAVKIKIDKDSIYFKKFMGLGKESKFHFKQLDGYRISILPNEYQDFEYLYLIIDGRKVIKLSQFYHSNYLEIKRTLTSKTKNLGIINFNLLDEFKEIFV